MAALAERSQPIDLVTLKDELVRASALEAVGGAAYLASLLDGVPRITNVEHWSRIIKEKAVLRNLIHASNRIAQSCYEAEDEAAAHPGPRGEGDLRHRRAPHPPGLRGHPGDRQGELPHHRPALPVQGAGHRPAHRLRGPGRADERPAEGRPHHRGRAARDGQDVLLPEHRAIRVASRPARRWASSRWRWPRSSSSSACCARTPAWTPTGCARATCRRRTGRAWPRPTRTCPRPRSSSTTPRPSRPLEMRAKCRRLKAEHGLGLVVVDYLQLVSGAGASRTGSRRSRPSAAR